MRGKWEELGTDYAFLLAICGVLIVVCLLTGFYLDIPELKAAGIIYAFMLLTPLFMLGRLEAEKKTIDAVFFSVIALFFISVASIPLRHFLAIIGLSSLEPQRKILGIFEIVLGVLEVGEWPVTEAAKHPLTVRMGEWALTLGVSPQVLVSLLINVPGPVAEEAFFRVFLISVLSKTRMGSSLSILATGITFGAVHWLSYGMDLGGLIMAAFAGIAQGAIYINTGSEAGVAVGHLLYNVVAILLGA